MLLPFSSRSRKDSRARRTKMQKRYEHSKKRQNFRPVFDQLEVRMLLTNPCHVDPVNDGPKGPLPPVVDALPKHQTILISEIPVIQVKYEDADGLYCDVDAPNMGFFGFVYWGDSTTHDGTRDDFVGEEGLAESVYHPMPKVTHYSLPGTYVVRAEIFDTTSSEGLDYVSKGFDVVTITVLPLEPPIGVPDPLPDPDVWGGADGDPGFGDCPDGCCGSASGGRGGRGGSSAGDGGASSAGGPDGPGAPGDGAFGGGVGAGFGGIGAGGFGNGASPGWPDVPLCPKGSYGGRSLGLSGNLQIGHPLDLDQSPGQTDTRLVYNSNTVDVHPIVQAQIPTIPAKPLPSNIIITLTWNGTPQTPQTFPVSGATPGQTLTVAARAGTAASATGRYPWTLTITKDYPETLNDTTTVKQGTAFVVYQGDSPIGPGWSFSSVDRLYTIPADANGPAGLLRAYGSGGHRFYQLAAAGAYLSPLGDNGTMTGITGGYLYTSPTGEKWNFNSAGMLTSHVEADGHEVTTFTYTDADSDGQTDDLYRVQMPDNASTDFNYTSGDLTSVVCGFWCGNRTYTITHDAVTADVTRITNPGGGLRTFTYNAGNRMKDETFGTFTRSFTYDSYGAISSIKQGVTTATIAPMAVKGLASLYVGNPVFAVTDAIGDATTWRLDMRGRPVERRTADGSTWQALRDSHGRVVVATDALGRKTIYERDAHGFVNQEFLPDGNTRSYQYNHPLHRLTSFKNERGFSSNFVYDDHGQLIEAVDALGNRTTFTYYDNGLLKYVTDPLLRITSFAYDSARRVTEVLEGVMPDHDVYYQQGSVGTSGSFYGVNMPKVVVDDISVGGEQHWIPRPSGAPVIPYTPFGPSSTYQTIGTLTYNRRTLMTYDSVGNLRSVQTGLANDFAYYKPLTTSYAYDSLNRKTAVIEAHGTTIARTTSIVYDAVGHVISVVSDQSSTNPHVVTLTYDYDTAGRLKETIEGAGSAAQRKTTFLYDAAGRLLSTTTGQSATSTYAKNLTTSYGYDIPNRTHRVLEVFGVSGLQRTTTMVYDAVGNLISVTKVDPVVTTRTTKFSYNERDWRTAVTEAAGWSNQRTTTTIYDGVGNVARTIDPLLHVTEYVYDPVNRRTHTTEAVGTPVQRTSVTTYDPVGNVITVTDPRGVFTANVYDVLNRPTQTIEAVGTPVQRTTTTVYDAADNARWTVSPRGVTTSFAYDALNRQTQRIDAFGTTLQRTTSMVYDAASNVIVSVDALTKRTTYAYDALNRRTVTTEPDPDGAGSLASSVTTNVYDAADNVTTVINPLGQRTTYTYDELNRLTVVRDALNGLTTMAYDSQDNRISVKDSVGNETMTYYDRFNRVTSETNGITGSRAFEYDANHNLTEMTDRNGRQRMFVYDALDRLMEETWWDATGSLVKVIAHTYDANDNQLFIGDGSSAWEFTYDTLNRVLTQGSWVFAYDAADNRTSINNGLFESSTYDALNRLTSRSGSFLKADVTYTTRDELASVTRYVNTSKMSSTLYTYDDAGRMTNIKHRNATDAVFSQTTYSYDAADRLTAENINSTTTSYAYDNINQVTGASGGSTETYSYDANGNRTMSGYSTGAHNRISSDGTWTYTHDNEGNIVKKSLGASSATWTFGYDHLNRMVWAEKRATDGGTLQLRAEYTYDVLGDRIRKRIDANGDLIIDTDVSFTYLDHMIRQERLGNTVHSYLVGDQIDQLFARMEGAAAASYMTDHLGSVRHISDDTGAVIATLSYDSYGNLTSAEDADADQFRFTGREWDAETGLYYYRARMYNPAIGRFTSEDPIGFKAEDENLYRYVGNHPTYARDPSGMDEEGWPPGAIPVPPGFPGYYDEYCKAWRQWGRQQGFKCWTPAIRKWVKEELKEGQDWLKGLPNCPCKIGVPPKNPDPNVWYDPKDADQKYHPGAKWCMRSRAVGGNPGQQCCYDEKGNLITDGPGAGTPDKIAPVNPQRALQHRILDVHPWEDCMEAGLLEIYLIFRPPNQGPLDPKTGKRCDYNYK